MAQVYDNLLGTEMTRTTDFGSYAKSLCLNISEIQGGEIALKCTTDPLILDLDTVTALGIILTELVTKSYDHAFPGGEGSITVSVSAPAKNDGDIATMIVSDTGKGFVAEYEASGTVSVWCSGLLNKFAEHWRSSPMLAAARSRA